MKSRVLLLVISCLSFSLAAQVVPNASFEAWTIVNYFYDPHYLFTSNSGSYSMEGIISTEQSNHCHSGQFAAKVKSFTTNEGTLPGWISIGMPGPVFIGGYPISDVADSLKWYMNYNIIPGDSGLVYIEFRTDNIPIAWGFYTFTGAESNYVPVTIPIGNYVPVQPDSFVFIFMTNINHEHAEPGGYIEVDDLQFINSTPLEFPNGDFEDWVPVSFEDPVYWTTSNILNVYSSPSVIKTYDAFDGMFAARIINQHAMMNDGMSYLLIGDIGDNGPVGGFPIEAVPIALKGYYKYSPAETDSGLLLCVFTQWNSTTHQTDEIARLTKAFYAAESYQEFELAFDMEWSETPDTMLIGFSPSFLENDQVTPALGSTLTVDDLVLEFSSGIAMPVSEYLNSIQAYPVPANTQMQLDFELTAATSVLISVYDVNGNEAWRNDLGYHPAGKVSVTIPLMGFASGEHLYTIRTDQGKVSGKFCVAE
jgi:hypothetical protein